MTIQTKTFYGIIAVLVAIVLIVSSVGGLYYVKYAQVSSDNSIYQRQLHQLNVKYDANILIDYGNGTYAWYNATSMQPGSNFYTATVLIANGNVNATFSSQLDSHYVTGIGGIQDTNSEFWFLWTYNAANSTTPWQFAQVGPDEITLQDGSIFAWTFCGMTSSYNPSCTPP